MESMKLLTTGVRTTTTSAGVRKRNKVNGDATAAMLIQIASEMLETSPTLRKRLGVTLSDLAAANKVRKELARRTLMLQ